MRVNEADKVPAAALERALLEGLLTIQDVIDWACRRIDERDEPEPYLIELATCQRTHTLDVVALLNDVAVGAPIERVLNEVLSMLPDVSRYTFPEGMAAMRRLFRIVRGCLGYNSSHPVILHCYWLDDEFDLTADGTADSTQETVLAEFRSFIDCWRVADAETRLRL
jgi:hypothetical protein